MNKLLIILSISFLYIHSSLACLNYYYSIDHEGHLHTADDLRRAFNTNFNLKLIEKKLKKFEKRLKEENDYKLLSDYAVLLLKGGKIKESLEILHTLSEHYPNEYQIAANLGTAYELHGDIELAIQYIKKGMQLNPDSHGGSEWVHVKILETKLELKLDSTYLSKHSVLNLTEVQKNDASVRNQILIQVRERFPFSSPPSNKIMESLLMDLADCYSKTASIEFAKVLYTIASVYYSANKEATDEKIKAILKLRSKFSNVQPEQTGEGDHIKIGGIRYKTMLDDNNPSNHKIAWESLLINTNELLSYAKMESLDPVEKDLKMDSLQSDTNFSQSSPQPVNKRSKSNKMYYFLLGLFLLAGAYLLKKRNR